jgi:hypothetical protein
MTSNEPRELRDKELEAQWQKMKDEAVSDEELSKWSVHLPPGYHKMVSYDLLGWMWGKKLDMMIDGEVSKNEYLISVHCARIRAHKLGYATTREYMAAPFPDSSRRYNIVNDGYYKLDPNGKYEFPGSVVSVERAEIAKMCNQLCHNMGMTLRMTGDCDHYRDLMLVGKITEDIAKYSINVLYHLSDLAGGYLDRLGYYANKVLDEWEKGIDPPEELKEGIYQMTKLMVVRDLGENLTVVMACMRSPHWKSVLIEVNDTLATRAIERQRQPASYYHCIVQ